MRNRSILEDLKLIRDELNYLMAKYNQDFKADKSSAKVESKESTPLNKQTDEERLKNIIPMLYRIKPNGYHYSLYHVEYNLKNFLPVFEEMLNRAQYELGELIRHNYKWNVETRNDDRGLNLAKVIEESIDLLFHFETLIDQAKKLFKEEKADKADAPFKFDNFWGIIYDASQYLCEPVINLLIDKYKITNFERVLCIAASCPDQQPSDIKEYERCLKKLVSAGAGMEGSDRSAPPLMLMLNNIDHYPEKSQTFVRVLLEAGADPTTKPEGGVSFADLIRFSGDKTWLAILNQYTHDKFKKDFQSKLNTDFITKTQKHPAFQHDWNDQMNRDLEQAPEGTFAIITTSETSVLAKSGLHGIEITYNIIYVENRKLSKHTLSDDGGHLWGVRSCHPEGFSTYNYKTVADLVDAEKDKFKLPYNVYRQQRVEKKADGVAMKAVLAMGQFATSQEKSSEVCESAGSAAAKSENPPEESKQVGYAKS